MENQYKFFNIKIETKYGNLVTAGFADVIIQKQIQNTATLRRLYVYQIYRRIGLEFIVLLEILFQVFKNFKVHKIIMKLNMNYHRFTRVLYDLGFILEYQRRERKKSYDDEFVYSIKRHKFYEMYYKMRPKKPKKKTYIVKGGLMRAHVAKSNLKK